MAPNLRERIAATRNTRTLSNLLLMFAASGLLWGCASPGVPVTRRTRKPRAITDLAGKQSGDSIVLSFTLPTETTRGEPMGKGSEILIYRAFETAGAPRKNIQPRLAIVIPSAMVPQYTRADHVVFRDVFAPKDFAAHAGEDAIYAVRTRNEKSTSAESNVLRMRILPTPPAIHDLTARIRGADVELSWSAPSFAPESLPSVPVTYEVYRAMISSKNSGPANATPQAAAAASESEMERIGETETPSYTDTAISPGESYRYVVRTLAKYPTGSVESAQSNSVDAILGANGRPEAPTNVTAAIVPRTANQYAVELSWAISDESGVAGYNVYRSRTGEGEGRRLNAALLLIPVFRDVKVIPGKQYFYCITAVNRAGQESQPSALVAVKIPAAQ